jgi:hypothetical protein
VNSVEQAIRAALDKGNAEDQGFRRRIYASASSALERSLAARNYSDGEIAARRQALVMSIRHIESDFQMALEDETQGFGPDIERNTARVAAQDARATVVPPSQSVFMPSGHHAERHERQFSKPVKISAKQKSWPWLTIALNGGFLLALILGGFWAYQEGKRIYVEATAPNPAGKKPALAENTPSGQPATIDWIEVFSARDTDLVSPAPGAKTQITSRDGASYVVMTGDAANEISVKIGAGLIQTFAGKRVLFNITARSLGAAVLETGMNCAFGDGTPCERKRFKIGSSTTEYMFAIAVSGAAKGDGALLIAPDLTGSGGALEIESIRATLVQQDAG